MAYYFHLVRKEARPTMHTPERPVKTRNLIAYGVGDLFGGGSFLIIGMLYMYFLTEVVGLSPIRAGLVFLIGKGWDGISDPLMGWLSDRTRSRFGRRRVYFLVGIIPIAVAFILMWIPLSSTGQGALFAYYSLAYIFFSTVYTMVMVPYAALNADMSTDYKVRARMSGSRMAFSGVAAVLGGTLPSMIIKRFPDNLSAGYLVMAIGFGILFALPFIAVFFGTWELPVVREEKKERKGIFRQFFAVLKNRSFRWHILMYIFAYSSMDVLMALFAYFLTYYLKMPGAYPIAMGALLLTQIGMLPVYVTLGNRWGKARAYILGMSLWLIGMALSLTLGPDSSVIALALVCMTIGTGTSAAVLIPWAILPSVIDVDELMSGEKRSGVYAGAMTLARKLIQGLIAMPLIGVVLQGIGFVSKADQSPETLQGLRIFFFIGPMIMIVLGILVASRFRITPLTHQVLSDEIERLRKGGSPDDVTEDTRKICEELTGNRYNDLTLVKDHQ